jgi:hypothetical protein
LVAELRELMKRREVGHPITIYDSPVETVTVIGSSGDLGQRKLPSKRSDSAHWPRVSIYRGHPFVRNHSSEAGKLINLPPTMEEFKTIIGTYSLDTKKLKHISAYCIVPQAHWTMNS